VSRFTVANILALVAALAAGMAALRDGSDLALRAVYTLTLVVLFVGLLGALVRREKAGWIGFALFGWGYALLACVPAIEGAIEPTLLTTSLFQVLVEHSLGIPPDPKPLRFEALVVMSPQVGTEKTSEGYRKQVDGQSLPLSKEESRLLDDYLNRSEARSSAYKKLETRLSNSTRIGHLSFCLAFATAGAVLGRVLADRSWSRPFTSP
jgi:hypothetical protein